MPPANWTGTAQHIVADPLGCEGDPIKGAVMGVTRHPGAASRDSTAPGPSTQETCGPISASLGATARGPPRLLPLQGSRQWGLSSRAPRDRIWPARAATRGQVHASPTREHIALAAQAVAGQRHLLVWAAGPADIGTCLPAAAFRAELFWSKQRERTKEISIKL